MRTVLLPLVTSLLILPSGAGAVSPPMGFSLESAVFERSGGADLRLTAVTSCWLEGGLEAEARLGFGSADRPGGRATATLTPGLGLRWGPGLGRWRPLLGVEAGLQLSADGRSPAATGAARAGIERYLRRDLPLLVAVAVRTTAGAGAALEPVVGLGWFP